jgi:RimJ/RimL family protein N-acetyltransferase
MEYYDYFWQGDQVRLRPLRSEDWEDIYRESFDSPSRQLLQLGIELPQSPEMAKEAIEKYANCKDVNGIIVFAIEALDGETVGGISLHGRNKKNGTFSFGVIIYRPFRNKGIAEDAVRILLRYCFHERRFQKCNSACVEGNEESIRLHQKLGFIEEGRRRRAFYLNGKYFDDVLFGLTREEFDETEKKAPAGT